MELRHIRYFAALAETLNFTRAAEKCHVTQSTLSHQIKQLEDELEVQLFNRIGKRVALTEFGDSFLRQILPALDQIDSAINNLQFEPQAIKGQVRIGATHSFMTFLIPHCISAFLERFPNINVLANELPQGEIVRLLKEGELDLGVAYRPNQEKDLWFEPLFNEEMVLVVSNKHSLATRKRVRMVELHKRKMTLLPEVYSTRHMLDECFRSVGAIPHVAVELSSIAPMLELIRHTDLAGIVGKNAIAESNGLSVIPLESPTPIRTPGLMWPRGGAKDEGSREFAKSVRRILDLP